MSRSRRKRAHLIGHREHVLHGPKWNDHQRIFLLQVEIAHVALMQLHFVAYAGRLALETRFQNPQHGRRIVHAFNLDAFARDIQQDAAGSAGDFQHGPARPFRQIRIERRIRQALLHRICSIVVLGRDVVRVGWPAHVISPSSPPECPRRTCTAPACHPRRPTPPAAFRSIPARASFSAQDL